MVQSEFDRLTIKRGKKDVIVDMNIIDFSGGKSSMPLEIYCQGFGHRVDVLSDFDNLLVTKEAKKLKAVFIKASIRNIPPSYDQRSLRSEGPSFSVDARVIIDAIKQKSIEIVKRSVIVSGFSEGAGVALAIAGEIDDMQKDRYLKDLEKIPDNKLRLWSLTNVIELEKNPKGTTIARNFIKEVIKIALIETVERYGFITGEDVFIKDSEDAVEFFGKLAKYLSDVKNWKDVKKYMRSFKDENTHLLQESLGKIITAKSVSEAIKQLKKMEPRSDICDQLGKNWEVKIIIPVNDTVYPWSKVKKTILEIKQESETNLKSMKDLKKAAGKIFFPNSKRVSFQVVGKNSDYIGVLKGKRGMGLGDVHVGPENVPDTYFEVSKFV